MANETAAVERAPGWDSKVRTGVVRHFGSVPLACAAAGVRSADLPPGRVGAIKAWSRLVDHFGGTEGVEEWLREQRNR